MKKRNKVFLYSSALISLLSMTGTVAIHKTPTPIHITTNAMAHADDSDDEATFTKEYNDYCSKYPRLHGTFSTAKTLRVAYLSKVGNVNASTKDSLSDLNSKVSSVESKGHESLWKFALNTFHGEHKPKYTIAQNDSNWLKTFLKDFKLYTSPLKHGPVTQGTLTSSANIKKHYIANEVGLHPELQSLIPKAPNHKVTGKALEALTQTIPNVDLDNIDNNIEKDGYESVWEFADVVVNDDMKTVPKVPTLNGNVPSEKSLNYGHLLYKDPRYLTQNLQITHDDDATHVKGTHIINKESNGSYYNNDNYGITNKSSKRRIRGVNYWSDGGNNPGDSYYASAAGSTDAGSPLHPQRVYGVIPYDWNYAIGREHSYVEWHDLIYNSGAKHVMVAYLTGYKKNQDKNKNGSVSAWYPSSAVITGYGRVDTKVTVDHMHFYHPWRGVRSLVFSKNLYDGFMENGLDDAQVHYTFYKPGDSKPIQLDTKDHQSYLEFRDIYGLHAYNIPQTTNGYDTAKNNESFVYNLWKNYPSRKVLDYDDVTGESINDNDKGYPVNEYTPVKDTNIRTYRSQIVNGYNYKNPSFSNVPAVGGKYTTRDIYNGKHANSVFFTLHGTSADFNATTGVGYANIQPYTNIQHMTKQCKGSQCNGNQHNGKPTPHQYPSYSPKLHGVRKSVKVSPNAKDSNSLNPWDDKDITGYSDKGGELRNQGQSYDYRIASNLPDVTKGQSYNLIPEVYKYTTLKWTPEYGNVTEYHTYHYHDRSYYINPDDHYILHDYLPQDVRLSGTPEMHLADGSTIDGSVSDYSKNGRDGQEVTFDLSESDWYNHNLQTYHADIPVKATHLPYIYNSGAHKGQYIGDDGNYHNVSDWYEYNNDVEPDELDKYGAYGKKTDEYDKTSNQVPVRIKQIQAHIYHYDFNHANHDMFPDKRQPLGFSDCGSDSTDPTDLNFKDYRWSDSHFSKNTPSDNSEDGVNSVNKTNSVLWLDTKYGYVNDTFDEPSINQYKNGDKNHHYRTVYPSVDGNDKDSFATKINKIKNGDYKDSRSVKADNKEYFPMNFNPSGCGNNAYSNSGFTQNNFIPYLVPQINLYNPNVPDTPNDSNPPSAKNNPQHPTLAQAKGSRMVIDTDRASHGLPFHFDMRAKDMLYGDDATGGAYSRDFKDDTVTMNVTSPVGSSNDTVYSATRPLVGNGDKHADLASFNSSEYANNNPHHVTKDEFPEGNRKHNWTGYSEVSALNHQHTDHYRYKRFNLNVDHIYNYIESSKALQKKYTDSDGQVWLPIHIDFTVNNSDDVDVETKPINTIAYLSTNTKATRSDFNNSKFSQTLPERTIKYGADGDSTWSKNNSEPRVLKEQMNITVPHNLVGKTGFGLTGNDFKFNYVGHLNALNYANKGTNALTAYPREFNEKDSSIEDDPDPREHHDAYDTNTTSGSELANHQSEEDNTAYSNNKKSLLSAPMVHVLHDYFNANTTDGLSNGFGENGTDKTDKDKKGNVDFNANTWDGLDSSNNDSNEVEADKYWMSKDSAGHDFPENLQAGSFYTSYGYLPKNSLHNDTNDGDATDNGKVALAGSNDDTGDGFKPNKDSYDKSTSYDPHISQAHRLNHPTGTAKATMSTYNGNVTTENESGYDKINREDIQNNGQNQRLFTPKFMPLGTYNMFVERPFLSYGVENYIHRLGGNHFDFDVDTPITFYAHQYLTKSDTSENLEKYYHDLGLAAPYKDTGYVKNIPEHFDESSLQPVLSGKQLFPANPRLEAFIEAKGLSVNDLINMSKARRVHLQVQLSKLQKKARNNATRENRDLYNEINKLEAKSHRSSSEDTQLNNDKQKFDNDINKAFAKLSTGKNSSMSIGSAEKNISNDNKGGAGGPFFREIPTSDPLFSTDMWNHNYWQGVNN